MKTTFAIAFALFAFAPACAPQDDETQEEENFYTEEWDQTFSAGKDDSPARIGRFETFLGADGKSYFHLLAGNGQKVLHSQGYTSPSSALDAIDTVRDRGVDPDSYRLLEARDGQWYFNLVAANYRVIGTSELYVTRYNAERGLATVVALVEGAAQRAATKRAAFQAFKGLDGQYYFHLRSGNGQIVLQSEGYTRRADAIAGTESVRENGPYLDMYEVRDAADGQAYFVLYAPNGEIIAVSETYASRTAANRGLEAVADLLDTAAIDDAR
jgi:uncharacterized protein YegP (UPF0339 family)